MAERTACSRRAGGRRLLQEAVLPPRLHAAEDSDAGDRRRDGAAQGRSIGVHAVLYHRNNVNSVYGRSTASRAKVTGLLEAGALLWC